MIEIKNRWERVANKEKWAARGTAFMTKAKATKAVWFPPKPVEAGGKAASTARRTTKKATKKPASAARRTTRGTKKATKKPASAARRTTTRGTKKMTRSVAGKKG